MNTFLIICDDWQKMEVHPQTICHQFESYLGKEACFLAPVLFAEYSCLTQFVQEEIDLVISNQSENSLARLCYSDFIDFWGWQGKLNDKVYNLSGGWRKLLSISLFLNQKVNNVLFVDFISHLSDNTICLILEKMNSLAIDNVGFVEYDIELFRSKLTMPKLLNLTSTKLIEI